jgi:hypothetical protein
MNSSSKYALTMMTLGAILIGYETAKDIIKYHDDITFVGFVTVFLPRALDDFVTKWGHTLGGVSIFIGIWALMPQRLSR